MCLPLVPWECDPHTRSAARHCIGCTVQPARPLSLSDTGVPGSTSCLDLFGEGEPPLLGLVQRHLGRGQLVAQPHHLAVIGGGGQGRRPACPVPAGAGPSASPPRAGAGRGVPPSPSGPVGRSAPPGGRRVWWTGAGRTDGGHRGPPAPATRPPRPAPRPPRRRPPP